MTIDVWRTPKRSGGLKEVAKDGRIAVIGRTVRVNFTEAWKGRDSVVHVCFHADSFGDLAQAMMRANPGAAIKAFGAALQGGIPRPN